MNQSILISRLKIILIILLPNLITIILRSWISLDRPIIYYDYFFLLPLVFLNINVYVIWLIYLFMIFADVSISLSNLFLFNYEDFIRTFKFFTNYDFSLNQILLSIGSILFLYFILQQLKRINKHLRLDKTLIAFFLISIISILSLDFINGSNTIESPIKKQIIKGNIAGFASTSVVSYLININAEVEKPKINNTPSITFETFQNDSLSNQMLILVESFGLLKNKDDQQMIENNISEIFEKNGWKIKWGKTRFEGSTTRAEIRELLNSNGDYRYMIRNNDINSIFNIKDAQGYYSYAAHSYNGTMFERNIWWKNIGIKEPLFSENFQQKNAYKLKLNTESPFISIQDENTFDFLQNESKKNSKNFAYLLTVNTHIPFNISALNNKSNLKLLSNNFKDLTELNGQLVRIINFLSHVSNNLDSNKFNKVLIVGDHMPPFNSKASRSQYDSKNVPYCIIYK